MNDRLESRARQIYERFLQRSSRDDEFNDWAGYRAELTDYIIRKTAPGSSLLILGAGKCNDLDLQKLAEHCGSITLSDYRPETAEEAFRQYGLEPLEQLGSAESSEQLESAQLESAAPSAQLESAAPSARLRFACADYVGITEEDYIEYTAKLLGIMQRLGDMTGSSLEEIAGPQLIELRQTLEQIYERNAAYRIDLGGETYDYAVVAGVHSQLNNSFRGLFQYVKKDVEDAGGAGGAENSRGNGDARGTEKAGDAEKVGDAGAEVLFAEELNTFVFQTTREHTGDLVDRFNEAVFAAVRKGIIYGFEKSIIYNVKGLCSPMIGTVDGARQAGEAIAELPAEDPWGCLWPLSRRRGIKFEMAICYLPVDKQTS